MPLSVAEIAFFEAHPSALPIYEAFAQAVGSWEGVVVRVQKTQITFFEPPCVRLCVLPARAQKGRNAARFPHAVAGAARADRVAAP